MSKVRKIHERPVEKKTDGELENGLASHQTGCRINHHQSTESPRPVIGTL